MASFSIHNSLKVAAHTAIGTALDGGTESPTITIHAVGEPGNTEGPLLATFTLDTIIASGVNPNPSTGTLILTPTNATVNASGSGTGDHAYIRDGNEDAMITLPVVTEATSDAIQLSSVGFSTGVPVTLILATIG